MTERAVYKTASVYRNFINSGNLSKNKNDFRQYGEKSFPLSTRWCHRATIRTKHISIICSSKHLGIFNAFTISITIKAGKFPGEKEVLPANHLQSRIFACKYAGLEVVARLQKLHGNGAIRGIINVPHEQHDLEVCGGL